MALIEPIYNHHNHLKLGVNVNNRQIVPIYAPNYPERTKIIPRNPLFSLKTYKFFGQILNYSPQSQIFHHAAQFDKRCLLFQLTEIVSLDGEYSILDWIARNLSNIMDLVMNYVYDRVCIP